MYARRDLADILAKQGKLEEALAFYREQLEVQRRVHGPDQAVTLWAMMNVAWTLRRIGPEHYSESEAILRDANTGMVSVLGKDHRHTLDVQWRLGAVLYLRDKIDEAMDVLNDNLERYRRTLGEDHASTQFVLLDLTRKREALAEREPH
jgi:tetratricopeptide (TPR) repeat protein